MGARFGAPQEETLAAGSVATLEGLKNVTSCTAAAPTPTAAAPSPIHPLRDVAIPMASSIEARPGPPIATADATTASTMTYSQPSSGLAVTQNPTLRWTETKATVMIPITPAAAAAVKNPAMRRTPTPISVAVEANHCNIGCLNPIDPNQREVFSLPRACLIPCASMTHPSARRSASCAKSYASMSPSFLGCDNAPGSGFIPWAPTYRHASHDDNYPQRSFWARTLSTGQQRGNRELSSEDIAKHRFATAMRRYKKPDVRSFLTDVERAMRGLEDHLAIERACAENFEQELAEMRSKIDALVQEATEARRRIIEQAKREATEIVERTGSAVDGSTIADTAEHAATMISRAEADITLRLTEIEQLCEAAKAEAAKTLTAAQEDAATTRAEAARVLEESRRQARTIRTQAETERTAIVEEISHLERIISSATAGDVEALETANVILRSGTEITIDLRDEAVHPKQRAATS